MGDDMGYDYWQSIDEHFEELSDEQLIENLVKAGFSPKINDNGNNLPCPFCGFELAGVYGEHPDLGTYFTECINPDCHVEIHYHVNSPSEALRIYNTRVHDKVLKYNLKDYIEGWRVAERHYNLVGNTDVAAMIKVMLDDLEGDYGITKG